MGALVARAAPSARADIGRAAHGTPHPLGAARASRAPRTSRTWRYVIPACVLLYAAVCTWFFYTLEEEQRNLPMYLVLVPAFLAVLVGPMARRAQPRAAWWPQRLGATCLVGVAAVRLLGPDLYIIDVEIGEALFLVGYLSFIVWLTMLVQYIAGGADRNPALDLATVTTGMALVVWSVGLGPRITGENRDPFVVVSVFPVIDILLLTLSVLLALRLSVRCASIWWLIAGWVVLLVGDVASAIDVHNGGYGDGIYNQYLISVAMFALAMIHPSVTELSRPTQPLAWTGRPTALIFVSFSPFALAAALPELGTLDIIVRLGLVLLLLTFLFLRLTVALRDMARSREESHFRATHDPLTGLLNRAALHDTLRAELEPGPHRRDLAVLYLDCDDFKSVNDTWGHQAGDTLLMDLAGRLTRGMPEGSMTARLGGDEFVVVTPIRDADEVERLAHLVQSRFDQPMVIMQGRTHAVTPSIGAVLLPAGEPCTADELLSRADAAMYEAKRQGKGRVAHFGPELAAQAHARSTVGDRLGHVVDTSPFTLSLQPIMTGDGYRDILGWEALARWDDEVLGAVPPEVFVPVAEDLGLSVTLFRSVLAQACHELSHRREAWPNAIVSVNVSASQLLDPQFHDLVMDAVHAAGLPPRALWLEIPEDVLAKAAPASLDTINRLRSAGIAICADNLGAGRATAINLTRMPIDVAKIDRTLIHAIGEDPQARRELAAVLQFVRTVGITTIVAEGVETPAQMNALREMPCPAAQGYLFGHPTTTAGAGADCA